MRLNTKQTGGTRVLWGMALLFLLPLLVGACASTQIAQRVDSRDPLKVSTLVPDQELNEIRGAYNSYYFAMNVGIDLTTSAPKVTVAFEATVPTGQAPSFEGNMVHFNDGTVSFDAGVGASSLGKGIWSVTNVAGDSNLVIANTNVNIMVPDAARLIPSITGLQTPVTLIGIK